MNTSKHHEITEPTEPMEPIEPMEPTKPTEPTEPTEPNFSSMTIKQLKLYCKEHQIAGYSGLCKKDIINIILNKPIPIKKEYELQQDDLVSEEKLQTKKVDELRFICRQMGLTIYKKTKSIMIHQILHNLKQVVEKIHINTENKPKIIRGQLCDLDSDDESVITDIATDDDINYKYNISDIDE